MASVCGVPTPGAHGLLPTQSAAIFVPTVLFPPGFAVGENFIEWSSPLVGIEPCVELTSSVES